MKKTRQTVISILSLIIILTFVGSAFAEDVCVIKWDGYIDTDCGTGCGGYSDVSGTAATNETSRTQQSAEELYDILKQYALLAINSSPSWDGSCWSHYFYWDIFKNSISASTCLNGTYVFDQTRSGIDTYYSGTWDVICGPDTDGDTLPDIEDDDTVYGTISGAVQEGVTVGIYIPNCGGDVLLDTTTTDANGYYAFGGLSNGIKTVVPELSGYTFIPNMDHPRIPQAEIKSYDFITRFIDNGDGTVTDNITGLVWLKQASCIGALNWSEAKSAAIGLGNGDCGLSDGSVPGDWRMPFFDELAGISSAMPDAPFQLVDLCPENCIDEKWWTDSGSGAMGVLVIHMGSPAFYQWPTDGWCYTWAVKDDI